MHIQRKILFRRRRPIAHSEDIIPFSYSVALICVLHLFVWSVGVCESEAKDFYLRDQYNFKSVNIRKISIYNAEEFENLLHFTEKLKEEAERFYRKILLELELKLGAGDPSGRLSLIALTALSASIDYLIAFISLLLVNASPSNTKAKKGKLSAALSTVNFYHWTAASL